MSNFNHCGKYNEKFSYNDFVFKGLVQEPFHDYIYGLPLLSSEFKQLKKIKDTESVLKENEKNTHELEKANVQTSGVRIRFVTDSKLLMIKCRLSRVWAYTKMLLWNSHGFDIYQIRNNHYFHRTVVAPIQGTDVFEEIVEITPSVVTEIYLPSYSEIIDLSIGVKEGCKIQVAPNYDISQPIVFYGNSITQGASASRSANIFPNIVSRYLNADIVNYSFSGACKGEISMAKQIADVDMSSMVIDYTRNASSFEEFQCRYPKFYQIIREKHPDIPIILLGGFTMHAKFDEFIHNFFHEQKKCIQILFLFLKIIFCRQKRYIFIQQI